MKTMTFKTWETIPPFCSLCNVESNLKSPKKSSGGIDWRNLEDGERQNKLGWLCQKSSIWMVLFHNACLLLLSLYPPHSSLSSLSLFHRWSWQFAAGQSVPGEEKAHKKKEGKMALPSPLPSAFFWNARWTVAPGLCVSRSLFPLATLLSKSSYQLKFGSRTGF